MQRDNIDQGQGTVGNRRADVERDLDNIGRTADYRFQ